MTIRNNLLRIYLCILLIFLFGCAGTATLNLNYQPTASPDALIASVSPVKIKLLNFEDKRGGRVKSILIGGRHAAFDVPMGDVYSARPVFEIIQGAVKSELARNGHVMVNVNEDFIFRGQTESFWVKTDVTPLYWDIIGEVSIKLEVTDTKKASSSTFGPYSAKNDERTYLYPSKSLMEKVLNTSLEQVMKQMSSDETLVKFLKGN